MTANQDKDNLELIRAGEYEKFFINFLSTIQYREQDETFIERETRLRPIIDNFTTVL